MHTRERQKAIDYGKAMPASRVVINSPTTHGAIGLSTELPPSMTLGCGSWGGNVTSDNVSPIHLMDIKRVAFETKPVNKRAVAPVSVPKAAAQEEPARKTISRDRVAELVDKFLSTKVVKEDDVPTAPVPPSADPPLTPTQSPVKTIIHELRPQSLTENGFSSEPVDFVSENDVRDAIAAGKKIFITAKTIVTPSARDLGEERDIFAKI